MAGVGPSGNCPRWTMCRATCLNKLGSVILKSIREGHLPHGTRPGSKTDGLGACRLKLAKQAQAPDASGRSLGAKLAPQIQKGAMGEQFSQLNHPSHRPPLAPSSPATTLTCHCHPSPSQSPRPSHHVPSPRPVTKPRHREERSGPSALVQRHGWPRSAAWPWSSVALIAPRQVLRHDQDSGAGLAQVQRKSRLSTVKAPSQSLRSCSRLATRLRTGP